MTAKRSIERPEYTVTRVDGSTKVVPHYVARAGESANDVARLLGLRLIGRRETPALEQVEAVVSGGDGHVVEAVGQ